jgi:hypothetical protein
MKEEVNSYEEAVKFGGPWVPVGCFILFQELGGDEMSKIKLAWRKISRPFRRRTPLQSTKLAITKRVRGVKRFLLKKRRLQDL